MINICAIPVLVFLLAATAMAGEAPVDYLEQVKPILKARCFACHGALKQKAGLRLDTASAIRRGGDGGPAIEPGRSGDSLILERVTESDPALRMPPEGAPLSADQVTLLRTWIDQGAASPADERPEADPRKHWAFVPPERPRLPVVRDGSWARNPIDVFLAEAYDGKGQAPMPPAPPEVLLRRIYVDLTGLPPTREELHEFLADPSDAAYERVVDRLLASPRYGERWARHWMDVWRYSDWYGRRAVPDVLNSYAQIWRWRDWIVRSLNEDKGYDRMVLEMIAADEIAPGDDANLVATGFLVRNWYRWNYNSWMKDNVEHTGKAFLGLTFNCAHCHDHKYDPIRHEDYFALRAVFEPLELRHDRVPGEPDPGPYPKYEYGKAYKPITSGMVRVFDEKLDAATFLYTRGESRNIVPGRPPILPGVPEFLGGRSFRVVPVELPAQAAYPGLKEFVRCEEVSRRESAVAQAERTLAKSRDAASVAARALEEAEARWSPGVPRAFADPLIGVLAFPTASPPPAEFARATVAAESARLGLIAEEAHHQSALAELASIRARIAADDVRYGLSAGSAEASARTASRREREAALASALAALTRSGAKQKATWQQAVAGARAALAVDSAAYTPLSPAYPTRSTGRRAALARWITDRANPLTARVAVNHIWRWHFHTPMVATTDDFGRNGAAPVHPKLLDWLAVELMEPSVPGVRPWSMKALHRRIVTSASYRMASHVPGAPGRETWHYPRTRMEAEVVRDSLVHLAGGLDAVIGGPDIDFTQGLTSTRRSLYFTHHGEARMAFLELFDAPDVCDAYRRSTSVVPQQALAMVNNDLLLAQSGTLAARLWAEAEGERLERESAFVTAAFEQVLTRSPSPRERALAVDFLARQVGLLRAAAGDPEERARRDLVHALFSHNDFITIH